MSTLKLLRTRLKQVDDVANHRTLDVLRSTQKSLERLGNAGQLTTEARAERSVPQKWLVRVVHRVRAHPIRHERVVQTRAGEVLEILAVRVATADHRRLHHLHRLKLRWQRGDDHLLGSRRRESHRRAWMVPHESLAKANHHLAEHTLVVRVDGIARVQHERIVGWNHLHQQNGHLQVRLRHAKSDARRVRAKIPLACPDLADRGPPIVAGGARKRRQTSRLSTCCNLRSQSVGHLQL
mmetsp:Transcript_7379/g.16731  ORF Transcript_7379/g.16731 Transcript_7379/m.16731 type:complete len:238 (-) Transcript_7379:2834-3547(-)